MIIDIEEIANILLSKKIIINGCVNVGTRDCEELDIYNRLGVKAENIVWVDALPDKVVSATSRGIPNVFNAIITAKDDEDVILNVANNCSSSSIFDFGADTTEHSEIVYLDKIYQKSITMDTFFERNNIDASNYNFWKLDIKGAELLALQGAMKSIKHVKALYIEVTSKELFKNGAIITQLDAFLAPYKFKRYLTNMTIHKCGDALYILDT